MIDLVFVAGAAPAVTVLDQDPSLRQDLAQVANRVVVGDCANLEVVMDAGIADAETLEAAYKGRPYSPFAGGAVPTRVFWGDTHLHTGLSMDAGLFGARLGLVMNGFHLLQEGKWHV